MLTRAEQMIEQFPPQIFVKQHPTFGCHDPDCEECHVYNRVCWRSIVFGGFNRKDLGKPLDKARHIKTKTTEATK